MLLTAAAASEWAQQNQAKNHFYLTIFGFPFPFHMLLHWKTHPKYFHVFFTVSFLHFNQTFHGRTPLHNACNYGHFLYIFWAQSWHPNLLEFLKHFIFKVSNSIFLFIYYKICIEFLMVTSFLKLHEFSFYLQDRNYESRSFQLCEHYKLHSG